MRICFLSHYFYPEGGACSARVFAHCRRWASAGHDVTVVTCVPNYPTGTLYPGYRNRFRTVEFVDNIKVIRVYTFLDGKGTRRGRSMNYLTYMVMALSQCLFARRSEVLIATSGHILCGFVGAVIGRLMRTPFILEVRDLWPESIVAVEAIAQGVTFRMLELIERYMYRAASHIVTVGDGYRERLQARGVDCDRISVVMNGVDRDLFNPLVRRGDVEEQYGIVGRFVVTYCGAIGMAHGLEVVIRAALLLRRKGRTDIVFLLVGDGARLEELRAEASAHGLDNIIFSGALKRSKIPAILASSHVSLIHLRDSPTFRTVMPSKIFESAAMALPIVLGVKGFARDFIVDAGCGLVIDPGSESQLVDGVLRLADDEQLRKRLGVAGERYVMERFERSALADGYLEIVKRFAQSDSNVDE